MVIKNEAGLQVLRRQSCLCTCTVIGGSDAVAAGADVGFLRAGTTFFFIISAIKTSE